MNRTAWSPPATMSRWLTAQLAPTRLRISTHCLRCRWTHSTADTHTNNAAQPSSTHPVSPQTPSSPPTPPSPSPPPTPPPSLPTAPDGRTFNFDLRPPSTQPLARRFQRILFFGSDDFSLPTLRTLHPRPPQRNLPRRLSAGPRQPPPPTAVQGLRRRARAALARRGAEGGLPDERVAAAAGGGRLGTWPWW